MSAGLVTVSAVPGDALPAHHRGPAPSGRLYADGAMTTTAGGADRPDAGTTVITTRAQSRRGIAVEIVLLLLVTLGMSGLTSVADLIEDSLRAARQHQSLADQQVTVAGSRSDFPWIDLARQLLSIAQLSAWGLLALYLLWRAGVNLSDRLGLNLRRPGRDLLAGAGLAALIGIPGLGLYALSHALGYSVTVVGSDLPDVWWRWPVAVLLAAQNGFLEEALVIGYLITRLRQLNWSPGWAVLAAAVLRGSYHLYQGYGGFVGNAIMGLVFGLAFLRWRRLGPLIVAHTLIDIVVFGGYPLLAPHVSWL